ncbi:MAG: GNAT family N-acetyltransferase [Tabrizicola sp.]|uniref:GNAT family N-acetyltransferase n=1 Tax=Tabrizicola sp. TaxID=2005166 RepID=UPI002735444E|nr:GNAT family N-acetyltransferase [Tabrizicola sp.]MDP3263113.1 GNAT family N-acetyltransferase [Tabrizicola sp.]MDP3649820.1 GNAT family N-acetyltransferase [Paracoccaceae bacterium]MDZ4088781.1 GNAT family N-acetyltransferase [Tabrizicola sp.]
MIRPLTRADDAAVLALLHASADYIRLERDEAPGDALVEEFFTDAPPGLSADDGYRAGLFDGTDLLALAEMSFGYPQPGDSYLGLMMVRGTARGNGAGVQMLRHLEGVARARGARQLFLAVLDANPRGRAFWHREGFRDTGFAGQVTLGCKTQAVQRLVKPL